MSLHIIENVQTTTNALTSLKEELDVLPVDRENSKPAHVASQLVAVLDARFENIIIAEELLVRTRENLRDSIQLESIHLSLSGDMAS